MDPFQTKFHIFLTQKSEIPANLIFLKCKSHHLAILINIWHIWEDRSRKVNNDEPDLRFFTETFDQLSAGQFENLVQRGGYGFYLFPKNGRYQDLGTKILVPRSWYQDPGTKILVPGMAQHGNIWHGTDHKGTAQKYLARHGSTRSGHGTARDVPAPAHDPKLGK